MSVGIRFSVLLMLLVFSTTLVKAKDKIHLWKGTDVKAKTVTLDEYIPKDGGRRMAVIVCPGGSYCWHDTDTEGVGVAKWLSENGFVAFVLNYRVQGFVPFFSHSRLVFRGNQHPNMISDVQRAIQYVRENADRYNIDKVGVMGFSAGGHLAMSAAEMSNTDFLSTLGIQYEVSLRPDFVVPVYPVVTFTEKCTHGRSRRALIGELRQYKKVMRDSLSLERHVPDDCPPVFLVNCKNDHVVKYKNSVLLDSALTAKGIRHKYIQYKTGGHGFGASEKKGTAESRQWKKEFLMWIDGIF